MRKVSLFRIFTHLCDLLEYGLMAEMFAENPQKGGVFKYPLWIIMGLLF